MQAVMSRIVRCPRCESLLREPAAETPLYQCSNCSTVLQAKHARRPEPCQHEQLFENSGSEDKILTNRSINTDSGLSEVEGELKSSSGDKLSPSLTAKDSASDQKKRHPKTVRTFRAFSRYKPAEDLANAVDSSVPGISFEDFTAAFNSLCAPKTAPAPENCQEGKELAPSQAASAAQAKQSGELNLQLNTANSANEKTTLEAMNISDLFQKPGSTAFPRKWRHDANASSSGEMPCVRDSARQDTQFGDPSTCSPIMTAKSSYQHSGNGGNLNAASLVDQSPQRSEDLYEAASEIDEYELSEFSSTMDEADAPDSGSPSQPSEDPDFCQTSQPTIGASATLPKSHGIRHGARTEVAIRSCSSLKEADEHLYHKSTGINRKVLSRINASSAHLLHNSPDSTSTSTSLCVRENCIIVQQRQKLHEKKYPYWPSENQPPYVLCQHCRCLLKIPHGLNTCNKIIQKLRCGGCSKVSIFSLPDFVIERSASPRLHLSHSPVNSSKDDIHDSSDDSSASKLRNQMQASISQLRKKAVKSFKGSKFRRPIDTLNVSETPEKELITEDEELFSTSVGPGEKKPNAESLKTKENADFDSFFRTDPQKPCHNSFQNTGMDSDCDSHESAEETSPLHELFGDESPLHSFEDDSSKDSVDDPQRGFKSRMKNLLRRSKKDLFKGQSKVKHPRVIVNGNLIPHSLVKKAEESAGPIHPGSYWYDIRAGFWGVMGGPCLGIVAPFIEEFDFPLPRQCSGGNTGILVNGRELHQIDLEKLAGRGLPSEKGKTYKIEIDGRLIDEASGEELRGLGKLAPSIERRGCGFGMFMPAGQ